MNIAGTNVYMFIIKYTIEGFKFVHQNLRKLLILVIYGLLNNRISRFHQKYMKQRTRRDCQNVFEFSVVRATEDRSFPEIFRCRTNHVSQFENY